MKQLNRFLLRAVTIPTVALFGLFGSQTVMAAPYIVQASTVSFGDKIVPTTGACDMDHNTSALTNTSGMICGAASGSRGHYRVFATPNTTVRIVVRPHNDNGNGAVFNPVGEIQSDAAGPIAYIEHNTTNINSGASGIVEIYVGGTLTLLTKPPTSTTFNLDFEIDFSEI